MGIPVNPMFESVILTCIVERTALHYYSNAAVSLLLAVQKRHAPQHLLRCTLGC